MTRIRFSEVKVGQTCYDLSKPGHGIILNIEKHNPMLLVFEGEKIKVNATRAISNRLRIYSHEIMYIHGNTKVEVE